MNNKGIVKQETIKIIIAVISVLILVYLAASLYKITQNTKEKEQAHNILTQIVNKVNSLETSGEMTIAGPRNWYMFVILDNTICVARCSDFDSNLKCLEEEDETRRCAPVKSELNVEVTGEQLLIYIIDYKFEKQNDKVIISKK